MKRQKGDQYNTHRCYCLYNALMYKENAVKHENLQQQSKLFHFIKKNTIWVKHLTVRNLRTDRD